MHVPGSPFRLKIGKQDADPAAVHAHGKGLEKGTTGHKSDFIVDTCNAGAGTLAVTIDGPSKVRGMRRGCDRLGYVEWVTDGGWSGKEGQILQTVSD